MPHDANIQFSHPTSDHTSGTFWYLEPSTLRSTDRLAAKETMMIRTYLGALGAVLLLVAAEATVAPPAVAQVGDVSPWPYPGWIPQDSVVPEIVVEVTYDDSTGLWRYPYTVRNGATAAQDIWQVWFRLGGWAAKTDTPAGWWYLGDTENTFSLSAPGIPGTIFHARLPDVFTESYDPPSEFQIPPGQSLSGFVLESPFPPGYVRVYVQGYAPVPFPPDPEEDPDAYYASNPVPHDTLNSQRLWNIGPARYDGVMTRGNLNFDGAEGFLGFMNLALSGTELRAPAPVALKLSLGGETVFPETFTAVLNGVDVSARFHPGAIGGADLVALFSLDGLPLVEGRNVLVTTIDGLLPGTTKRAIDEDLIQFDAVP